MTGGRAVHPGAKLMRGAIRPMVGPLFALVLALAMSSCRDATGPTDLSDGRPIVFMALDGPSWRLGKADPASQGAWLFGPQGEDRQFPAVSRSGKRLAYVSNGTIYTANADGTDAIQLPGRYVTGVRFAWSPDETRLTVAAADWGYPNPAVYIVTVATGAVDTLRLASGRPAAAATWSPDGTRLLVEVSSTYMGGGIVSAALDGSDERSLIPAVTDGVGWVRDASYSPDGRRIVYAKSTATGGRWIWVADADGSNERHLSTEQSYSQVRPVWSPTGRFVAYSSDHACTGATCPYSDRYDIAVVALDGSGTSTLTSAVAWGGTNPTW